LTLFDWKTFSKCVLPILQLVTFDEPLAWFDLTEGLQGRCASEMLNTPVADLFSDLVFCLKNDISFD